MSSSHDGCRDFLRVSLIPATDPRLLATSLIPPLISCCKLNFQFPPFTSEAGEKMGRILPRRGEIPPHRCSKLWYLLLVAFRLLSQANERRNRLCPSGELKQNRSGSVYQRPGKAYHSPPRSFAACSFNWLIFLTHIKGKISLRNIAQHPNELLSLSDLVAGWRR